MSLHAMSQDKGSYSPHSTNIRMTITYDGTRFLGWQKTSMGPSIQETLEKALSTILQEPIVVEGASRTDAGVHARGQVANFLTFQPVERIDRLVHSLNSLLPKDVAVIAMTKAPKAFHPTLDNIGKEYQYYICQGPHQLPIHRYFSWHVPQPLDIEKMRAAAQYFIGEKDFSALLTERNEHSYKDHVRHITAIEIDPVAGERLAIRVTGKTFLYKMVRTLVGTLVYVGCDKIPEESIPEILANGKRALAGITAPAHGLHLASVHYAR